LHIVGYFYCFGVIAMRRAFQEMAWYLLLLGVSIFTVSFWQTFSFAGVFQPVLFLCLLLAIFDFPQRAVALAAIGGVLLDMHSALPFGVFTTALLVSIAAVLFSQETFFKDRAVHIVVLHAAIATLLYFFVFFTIAWLAQLSGVVGAGVDLSFVQLLRDGLIQTGLHSALAVCVYVSTVAFGYRFMRAHV
jgi:hypothetical protein